MGICTYCISKAVIYMDMRRSSLAGMLLGCKLNFELSSKLIHWILIVLHLCTYYWVLCSDWWKDQCMHPNIYLGYWDLAPVPIDQCQDFLFLLTTHSRFTIQRLRIISSFHCPQNDREKGTPVRHLVDFVLHILLKVCGDRGDASKITKMN